jgi:hypothetical protein
MIDGQDDKLFVDDVERVSKLAGIADSGHMVKVGPMPLQKRNQFGRGAIPVVYGRTADEHPFA